MPSANIGTGEDLKEQTQTPISPDIIAMKN
jgi:hypothetical protein